MTLHLATRLGMPFWDCVRTTLSVADAGAAPLHCRGAWLRRLRRLVIAGARSEPRLGERLLSIAATAGPPVATPHRDAACGSPVDRRAAGEQRQSETEDQQDNSNHANNSNPTRA